jgi:hypothetical protein
MNNPRRYRMVEHANDSPTGLMLCTVDAAAHLGVATQPDDDLIVVYRPDMAMEPVEQWANMLRAEGYDVEWTPR